MNKPFPAVVSAVVPRRPQLSPTGEGEERRGEESSSNPTALPSSTAIRLLRRKAADSRGLESELREIDARIAYVKARDHLLAVLDARRDELRAQIVAAPREVQAEYADWVHAAGERRPT